MIKDLDSILDQTEPTPLPSDTLGTQAFLKHKKHVAGIIGLKLSNRIRELLVTDVNRRDPVALWRDIKSHFCLYQSQEPKVWYILWDGSSGVISKCCCT